MSEPLIEKHVLIPVTDVDGTRLDGWHYAGAVDRVEGTTVIDWKSASNPENFAEQKAVSFQPECYAMALRALGHNVTHFEYRVIQTPGIKYCSKDKDVADYEHRCFQWLMEQPGRMLTVRLPITEASLEAAQAWIYDSALRMQHLQENAACLHNESACFAYNTRCPYLQLCKAGKYGDDMHGIIAGQYRRKGIHSELQLGSDVDPSRVVTYSSAAKLGQCEMRWYFRYVMGIELDSQDTPESLYLGSAMHKGLESIDKPLEEALSSIDAWERENPTLGGSMGNPQRQAVARAKAMVSAAKHKWGARA